MSAHETVPPDELVLALTAASHALRSYEFGNSAPDLAQATADAVDRTLAAAGITVIRGHGKPALDTHVALARQIAGDVLFQRELRRYCDRMAAGGIASPEMIAAAAVSAVFGLTGSTLSLGGEDGRG